MNAILSSRPRLLNAGLFVGAALAALTAMSPSAHAAGGFDRPAGYDVRDTVSSGPVGAVSVNRTAAPTVVARDARCDVRDVCSETPPIAVKSSGSRPDTSARNPACDVRDVCTTIGIPLAKEDSAVRFTRNSAAGSVIR